MAIGSIICGASTPKMKRKKAKATERSWIEATFQKRECSKFIPSAKDEHRFMQVQGDKNAEYDVITTSRCCCGYSYTHHCGTGADVQSYTASNTKEKDREQWSPGKNTRPFPTDAYGTIEFQGGPHPTKAQYVRLAHDTRPEPIVQLLCREWNLGLPKLLITVHGGRPNFDLQPSLKKVLRKGLLKAAKTTGAWIFTGGTNTGVTRQVGDALLLERSQRQGRVVSIGIAPWGILDKSHELVSRGGEVPYDCLSSPWSKYAVLNNRHAYFLLVDNGTGGRYGAEIVLRRKLEKYISNLKLQPYTHSSIPVVALVIEGGTNTIRSVLEYVTDDPPVPVVVCDGSGRAADLIAFMHKYASEGDGENGDNEGPLESMREHVLETIKRTFKVSTEPACQLYSELLQCTRKKHLITVFRITQDRPQELDQTILTALFKSKQLSPAEQLSLSLIWNRVDIARSEIFVYGQKWPPGALEQAMMQALQHDRIDFVKLLLENGVSMRKFLSIPRLEELYNTKEGPSNTLGYILRDVRPNIPRGYMYTLHDIGLVINKLMGGAYRSQYTRRRFRVIYTKVMKRSGAHQQHMHRNSCAWGGATRYYSGSGNKQESSTISLLAETLPANRDTPLFDYPFNELLIWAVLTKRQQMALLMWQHGEEALAKSLVALKLYKAMAHEAAEDDLETEVYDELRNYGKEFENIALELLDYCYRQDDDQTQQLLTSELQNWSGQTCLSLAVTANHRPLLAHTCSQIILADLWMGGLRTRKNTNLKVVLGLVCPFYIARLEFKSREELQLMPQTQEEHLIALEDEKEDSDSEHGAPTGPDVEIFMEPYFMLYGEVYADNIDPDCGDEPGMIPCLPGRWITPAVMSIYLLVANILLINLLIAVFNNIFNEVNAVAHQVWMFQRFTVVMEYEQKPVLPPPLIVVCHIYLLVKYLLRYVTQGKASAGETYDNGLKLFLEVDDMERLYDFEEDCVEGYFREQELKLQMSTEERVKVTTERVENMHQKIEDIDKKEHTQNASLQAVEFRIRKLEELNEQTLAHLGVIHRFMATHMPNIETLSGFDVEGRVRRVSERSEVLSETDSHTQLPTIALKRKRLMRSLTDGTFLNMGQPLDDDVLKHSEVATSRENLSRNESSVSGDGQIVQDDMKTTTSQETEVSKGDGEGETIKKESQTDSREPSMDPSVEPSREPSSRELSTDPSRQTSRELSRETSREATSREATSKEPSREASSEAPASEPTRQDSTERPTRQNSRTRSESDDVMVLPSRGVTWAEPRVAVIPSVSSTSSTQRSILLAMRAEYTSITDELESYCGLLSPPRTPPISPPPSRARHHTGMSNAEMAWQIENEHLRDAEECDYQQMEDLIQRRYIGDDDEPVHTSDEASGGGPFFISNEHRHQLRRSSAIDEESRRPAPTISVTREIEQTLSRPPIRDSESSDPNDKNLSTVPAPASETMC
ncbi:transient receptor potential cation channel, subfamily M isoform X8 [Colletes latitarsis]|uniref:transient receptor potential cation channel, subfamily M isoform X8 n=1 Tax=Colletes latitarsis TaxID=2605962 RepID=UPI0040358D52